MPKDLSQQLIAEEDSNMIDQEDDGTVYEESSSVVSRKQEVDENESTRKGLAMDTRCGDEQRNMKQKSYANMSAKRTAHHGTEYHRSKLH